MRPVFLTLLVCFLALVTVNDTWRNPCQHGRACSAGAGPYSVTGVWAPDAVETMWRIYSEDGVPDTTRDAFAASIPEELTRVPQVIMDVRANGTLQATLPSGETRDLRWREAGREGDTIRVQVSTPEGEEVSGLDFEFLGPDSVSVVPPGQTHAAIFERRR